MDVRPTRQTYAQRQESRYRASLGVGPMILLFATSGKPAMEVLATASIVGVVLGVFMAWGNEDFWARLLGIFTTCWMFPPAWRFYAWLREDGFYSIEAVCLTLLVMGVGLGVRITFQHFQSNPWARLGLVVGVLLAVGATYAGLGI